MSKPRVLVIEGDEWVAGLLGVALREAGYEVVTCEEGALGIAALYREAPACVICDVELPDCDGLTIARSLRSGQAARTPLIYLAAAESPPQRELELRIQALAAGGDTFLLKPYRSADVAAQIGALLRMAERFGQSAPSAAEPQSVRDAPGALEGDLGLVAISTVLTVVELERQGGRFEVMGTGGRAALDLEGGAVAGGSIDGKPAKPLQVLRAILGFRSGRFRFQPTGHAVDRPPPTASVGALLMEAARIEDEVKAGLPVRPSLSTRPPASDKDSLPPLSTVFAQLAAGEPGDPSSEPSAALVADEDLTSIPPPAPPRLPPPRPKTPPGGTPKVAPEPVTPEPVTPEPVTPEPVTPEPVTPEPLPKGPSASPAKKR